MAAPPSLAVHVADASPTNSAAALHTSDGATSPVPLYPTATSIALPRGTVPHPLSSHDERPASKSKSQAASTMAAGRSDYLSYLRQLHKLWTDNPMLTVSFTSLAYTIPVPVDDGAIPNLLRSLLSFLSLSFLRPRTHAFQALQPNSGILYPGPDDPRTRSPRARQVHPPQGAGRPLPQRLAAVRHRPLQRRLLLRPPPPRPARVQADDVRRSGRDAYGSAHRP